MTTFFLTKSLEAFNETAGILIEPQMMSGSKGMTPWTGLCVLLLFTGPWTVMARRFTRCELAQTLLGLGFPQYQLGDCEFFSIDVHENDSPNVLFFSFFVQLG